MASAVPSTSSSDFDCVNAFLPDGSEVVHGSSEVVHDGSEAAASGDDDDDDRDPRKARDAKAVGRAGPSCVCTIIACRRLLLLRARRHMAIAAARSCALVTTITAAATRHARHAHTTSPPHTADRVPLAAARTAISAVTSSLLHCTPLLHSLRHSRLSPRRGCLSRVLAATTSPPRPPRVPRRAPTSSASASRAPSSRSGSTSPSSSR